MSKRLARQAEMYAVSTGPSIREMIQEDLDAAVDELMEKKNRECKWTNAYFQEMAEAKGFAAGLARALAIMINPYDFESALVTVRAEAMERWEEREHGDLPVSEDEVARTAGYDDAAHARSVGYDPSVDSVAESREA